LRMSRSLRIAAVNASLRGLPALRGNNRALVDAAS
jgi:hypothetical protein